MASKLLGRCTCPLCDDDKTHVKIKTDKGEGATAYPYMHCRECGFQAHTKNQHQAELLLKKTRPENIPAQQAQEKPAATPEIAQPSHESTSVNTNTPPAAKTAYTGRFGRSA